MPGKRGVAYGVEHAEIEGADVGQQRVKLQGDSPAATTMLFKKEIKVKEPLLSDDSRKTINGPADYIHHPSSILQALAPLPRERCNEPAESPMSVIASMKQGKNENVTSMSHGGRSNFTNSSAASVAAPSLTHLLNERNHMSPGLGETGLGKGNMGQVDDERHYQHTANLNGYRHHHHHHLIRQQGSSGIETALGNNDEKHHQENYSTGYRHLRAEELAYFSSPSARLNPFDGEHNNNRREMGSTSTTPSDIYEEQKDLMALQPTSALRGINSSNGSTSSSSPVLGLQQKSGSTTGTSTFGEGSGYGGKKESMSTMMIPQQDHNHHQYPFDKVKQRSPISPYVMNGDNDDRCTSRNRRSSSNSSTSKAENILAALQRPPLSPGGFSSNKSFCSGPEGDSPPSPLQFPTNLDGNNNPGQNQGRAHALTGRYPWMKQISQNANSKF